MQLPSQLFETEMVYYIDPLIHLPQIRSLLQHSIDHDGYLPIGEHIYLKLRAGQSASFEQLVISRQEAAAAFLVYLPHLAQANFEEMYPEAGSEARTTRPLAAYMQLFYQPKANRVMVELVVHRIYAD